MVASQHTIDYIRPHTDATEGWLRSTAVVRIGILSFVTVGAAFIRAEQGIGLLLLLYCFWFSASIWYLQALYRNVAIGARGTWAQVLVDFVVVAVTVAFTHGPLSFFTFIFVIVVLEAGVLLGLRQGFVVSSLASLYMGALFILGYSDLMSRPESGLEAARGVDTTTFELWYHFLVQCLAFYLTAFISGYWSARVTRLQQFQREILDNMNSGFLITDARGFVIVQNKAADHILQMPPGTAVGRAVQDILRVEGGAECPVTTALRAQRDFSSYEFRVLTYDNRRRLLGLTTNRIQDATGRTSGIIAAFSDLTAMDALRQEMRRQDRMAVVGELAAGVAHEIRNPLAIIRGAVDELAHQMPQEGLPGKLTNMVMRESDHLNEIVSGFLDFAREPVMHRETIDVRDAVREVHDLLERECGADIRVKLDLKCPEYPCWVSADPSKLKQVFMNLGKNALEAIGDAPGNLQMVVANGSGPLEIRFEDSGPGIPPDTMDKIFEPFYTTKSNGVGMGLAVCSRIVTAHDGTIHASSREGGGSVLIIKLPAARMDAPASASYAEGISIGE
ncbi:MAG: ATP-binding protein [Candidatus Hydrogenedentales bacterium]